MSKHAMTESARSKSARIAIGICVGAVLFMGAAFVAWFVGLDILWSIAAALVMCAVGTVLAMLRFEEQTPWDAPARETPRGTRLTVAMLEASLAACDRLARPPLIRRARALVMSERDDRLAQSTVVRRMRDLLVMELHAHGVDPATCTNDAVVELLGPEALTLLRSTESHAVPTTAVSRCLDAIERLTTAHQGSR